MSRMAVAALALATISCAEQTGALTPEGIVTRHLDQTEGTPHRFTYTERTEEREVSVRGVVNDHLRRSARVTENGTPVLEMVLTDDAVALRLLDPEHPVLGRIEDPVLVAALLEGRWVVDHTAAPPLFAPVTSEGSVVIGEDPVLDSMYVFQYARSAIDTAFDVREHSPDALDYVRQDDPFADLTDERLSRDRGYRRFDLRPPFLPGRAQRGTEEAIPSVEHFRKLSVFVKGRVLARIVEEISYERREFRRAREGRESERYLRMLADVRAGHTREPLRLRRMSYEATDLGELTPVQIPPDAVPGDLSALFGDVEEGGLPTTPEEAPGQTPDTPDN